MSGWLKADGTTGDAYLLKDLGGIDELYLGYTISVSSALLADLLSDGSAFNQISDVTTPGLTTEALGIVPTTWEEELSGSVSAPTPTAQTYTIAIHAKISTDTLVVTINGTPYDLSSAGMYAAQNYNQFDQLQVGLIFSSDTSGDIAYISGVTVGTTGAGSSDILDEDFTDPTFALWDETSGAVSLVDDLPDDPGDTPVWTVEHWQHENQDGGGLIQVIKPENLHFVLNLAQVGGVSTIDYEISLDALDDDDDPVVTENFVIPYQHDFLLKRSDLDDPIMGGIITQISGQDDGDTPIDHVEIEGADWLHYLECRFWPYDPVDSYVLWDGPAGVSSEGGLNFNISAGEVGEIVQSILETVRDLSANWPAVPDAMPNYRGAWDDATPYLVDDCVTVSTLGQVWIATVDNTGDEPPGSSWDAIFPSFSLTFTTEDGDFDDTDVDIDYQISTFDTTSLFDLIQTLSQQGLDNGGFDFEITWDKHFKLHYPEVGDPDTPIFEIVVDMTSHLANALSAGLTNTGPQWTHFLGTASSAAGGGPSTTGGAEGGINKHFPASSATFRRLDGSSDFGTLKALTVLESLTALQLAFGANPVHTIPIEVNPAQIEGFWLATRPGQYIQVIYDLGFYTINQTQKIVSMDCTADTEGNEVVMLGFNQYYDASDNSGIDDI